MTKPFAGVRILDFTRYLAGPYGTYQLALLGADVVKIESREGDETRGQLADPVWAERKMAPSFLAVNGNKRSITLDLRRPEAVEVVMRLVVDADVVWENFRGGVMDRLGLGYEVLAAINPRLIYCAVSGFGRTGPERATAAFDGKLQAMSGIMSITGKPASGPTRAGFALCDTIGGMTARTPGAGSWSTSRCWTPRSRSSRDRCPNTPWPASSSARSAMARSAGSRPPAGSGVATATSYWLRSPRSSSRGS